jgi:hypothetical protein
MHEIIKRLQRRPGACLVAVLLATLSLTAGTAWGAAGGLPGTGDQSFNPGPRSAGNHCVSPEGVDANELLGISEQLLQPDACNVVETGEFYVPLGFPGFWWMNTSWEAVPADYTPSAPTPLEDFISKVRSVTYVVDPGTKHERSYRFTAQNVMDVRTIHDFFPETGPAWPTVLFLAKLPPLPPGDHRLGTSIEMSARHCDGLGTDPVANCLGAGITKITNASPRRHHMSIRRVGPAAVLSGLASLALLTACGATTSRQARSQPCPAASSQPRSAQLPSSHRVRGRPALSELPAPSGLTAVNDTRRE